MRVIVHDGKKVMAIEEQDTSHIGSELRKKRKCMLVFSSFFYLPQDSSLWNIITIFIIGLLPSVNLIETIPHIDDHS